MKNIYLIFDDFGNRVDWLSWMNEVTLQCVYKLGKCVGMFHL